MHQRTLLIKCKDSLQNEKIFANNIFDEGLIFKNSHNSTTKDKHLKLKMDQRNSLAVQW